MNYRKTAMTTSRYTLLCMSLFLLYSLPLTVRATIILGTNTWSKAQLEDWTKNDDWTKPSKKGSYLNAYLESAATLDDKTYALPYISASNLFIGNWPATLYTEPDFWSSNAVPKHGRIIRGSINNDISIETRAELGSAFFTDYTDWEYDVDQATFVYDLESIDWISEFIWTAKLEDQAYGLDNSLLVVPEPHTIVMLLASGATAAMAFRKKRAGNK